MKSLLKIQSVDFHNWLNVAIGYGDNGMVSAYQKNEDCNRMRQYLLSLDIDLTRIKTKSKSLNSILHLFGFIKFPMPTIELRNNRIYTHPIYY